MYIFIDIVHDVMLCHVVTNTLVRHGSHNCLVTSTQTKEKVVFSFMEKIMTMEVSKDWLFISVFHRFSVKTRRNDKCYWSV